MAADGFTVGFSELSDRKPELPRETAVHTQRDQHQQLNVTQKHISNKNVMQQTTLFH